MDLGRELKILHVSDIKIEKQKELFGEKWNSISADRLTESLDNFEIRWEDSEERQDSICYSCSRSNFVRDPHLTLKQRRKHQRLAYQEKLHIFKRFIKEGLHIRQLCSEYCINRTTIQKIVKDSEGQGIRWDLTSLKTYRNLKYSRILIEEIAQFHKDSNLPFVAKDIKTLVHDKYRIILPVHIIRDLMKNKLKLNYKKGKFPPF